MNTKDRSKLTQGIEAARTGEDAKVKEIVLDLLKNNFYSGGGIIESSGLLDAIALMDKRQININLQECAFKAVKSSNLEILKFSIENGVNVNQPDQYGRFLLICAASKESCENMAYLLAIDDVEVNKTNFHSLTALDFAIRNKHEGIERLLRNAGAIDNSSNTKLEQRGINEFESNPVRHRKASI